MKKRKLTIEEVKKSIDYKSFLLDFLNFSEEELLEQWNLYCDDEEKYDDIIALSLHEAIENTGDESITNIIDLLKEKEWKYEDSYFALNENRKIVSSKKLDTFINKISLLEYLTNKEYKLTDYLLIAHIELI